MKEKDESQCEFSSVELIVGYINDDGTDSICSIRKLIADGMNLEKHNKMGRSALAQAVVCGKLTSVKIFIGSKVDLNARTREGNYPIIIAAFKGYFDIAKALVDAGVNVHIYNADDKNALMLARQEGHQATEELLLEAGAV